nr:MAG TPA: hypothetical protein [Caudoviricetes sp.]
MILVAGARISASHLFTAQTPLWDISLKSIERGDQYGTKRFSWQ